MLLIDPGHDYDNLDDLSTVPTHGTVGGNIAWREALKLFGLTAEDEPLVQPTFTVGAGWGPTKGAMERTPKGSLHGIFSQSTDTGTTEYAGWVLPEAFGDYIAARLAMTTEAVNHEFALALHYRTTRGGIAGGTSPIVGVFTGAQQAVAVRATVVFPSSETNAAGTPIGTPNLLNTETLVLAACKQWPNGVITTPDGSDVKGFLGFGLYPPFSDALHHMPSYVFRRAHLIDLTAAGLTARQFCAREAATATANFAVGGRWNGDSVPTAPSTIP
jgi:hypothetical protein